MSTTFAIILYVRMVIEETGWMSNAYKEILNGKIFRQVSRIISDVCSLAFTYDTFYIPMRVRLSESDGTSFLQLDGIFSNYHCHQELKKLPDNDVQYDKLLNEFKEMIVKSDAKLNKLRD